MNLLRKIAAAAASIALFGCTTAPAAGPAPAQAQVAPAMAQTAQTAQPFVIAANPLAAEAGLEMLKRGGSAIDAAVAVQAMLSLVEPQSSGLGGGAFINHYDASTRQLTIYDGRETAPAQAVSTMFLKPDGAPIPFREAVVSGKSIGVPGTVAVLAMAHTDHGNLPWSSLFGSAQRTASQGFAVSPRLASFIHSSFPQASVPDARAYFSGPDGALLKAGETLRNPDYAEFLGRLAAQGPGAFYSGATAARIVEKSRAGPLGGTMTMADLAQYRPVRRDALCRPWRVYLLCAPPPPSSGVGLIQLMKLLETTDIAQLGPADPRSWFLFAEASRIMYADRDLYVGDPAFADVPVEGLLDPAYIAQRARLIGTSAGPPPEAGVPAGAPVAAADRTAEASGTTHFIIRDAQGNVVSITATVESVFGTGRMVDGFFLNNELTDFSFLPVDDDGRPVVNAVAPGKRPRSSMVPTILLTPQREFAGALGSGGGNAILAFVAKTLVGAVDWGLSMPDALALPNLFARGSGFHGEVAKFPPAVLEGLATRGIILQPGQGENSGLTAVLIRGGRIDGGADPRREGVVLVLAPGQLPVPTASPIDE
jgi:gamma-glutamyltranspeptidase / glutathione hydrolase